MLLTTHPDAVAEAYWNLGDFANQSAWRKVPASPAQRAWLARARSNFESAVELAPLSEKYALSAGNQAALLGDYTRARQLFMQAAEIDPGGADAIAGLGVAAFAAGDRGARRAPISRARARARSELEDGARAPARSRYGPGHRVKVALDAQLTVGTATGIGEYVRGLIDALRAEDVDVVEFPNQAWIRGGSTGGFIGIRCCCRRERARPVPTSFTPRRERFRCAWRFRSW